MVDRDRRIGMVVTAWVTAAVQLSSGASGQQGAGAAATAPAAYEDAPVEATSLAGEPLRRTTLPPEVRARRLRELAEARLLYEQDPSDEAALIWLGRRRAYLGRYQDAIELFSLGISQHPDSHKLLRHRGHRYITVRKLPEAVADLEQAAELIADRPDEVEPDGMPNRLDIPTSSSHTNIFYHLGLARYVRGNYRRAAGAYRQCLSFATNDDMRCAASYWLYLSLRRAGEDDAAAEVLVPINDDMRIIENEPYHRLLLLYKGERSVADLTSADELWAAVTAVDAIGDATTGYGIGAWFLLNGDVERARRTFDEILAGGMWPAFGYIAAEAEVVRLSLQEAAERDMPR